MKFTRLFQISMLTSVVALLSFVPVNKKKPAAKKTTKHVKRVIKDSITNPYYIIVDKSEYELYVYDDEGWYATYPIVFGSNNRRSLWLADVTWERHTNMTKACNKKEFQRHLKHHSVDSKMQMLSPLLPEYSYKDWEAFNAFNRHSADR